MILTTLNERRREMAILRSVGARPLTILSLLVTEAGLLTFCGVALGTVLLYVALIALQPFIDRTYGLHIAIDPPTWDDAGYFATFVLAKLASPLTLSHLVRRLLVTLQSLRRASQ